MSTKTGWLKDKNGKKFAPKTLSSRVIMDNGATLQDSLNNVNLNLILQATSWTGDAAPYKQTILISDMRSDMSPMFYLNGSGDEVEYAYDLITGYDPSDGSITFYAADKPTVSIPISIKGSFSSTEVSFIDNVLLVPVHHTGFTYDDTVDRYVQEVAVENMTSGLVPNWSIAREGEVFSEIESEIAAKITDIKRQTGAIKIYCTEAPTQDYVLILFGTLTEISEGDVLISNYVAQTEEIGALRTEVAELKALVEAMATLTTVNTEEEAKQDTTSNTYYFVPEEE